LDADEPAGDELELRPLELREQREEIGRRQELKHRRVVRRAAAKQESQPILEAKHIRDRAHERASWTEDAIRLLDECLRGGEMLEELARDDDVEALVGERQPAVGVRPHGLDAERGRLLERLPVDVDSDDLVAVEVRPSERARATADVEDAPTRPSDVLAEQLRPLRRGEDESAIANRGVVFPVASLEVLKRLHCRKVYGPGLGRASVQSSVRGQEAAFRHC
jgi:hypothetical protein